LASEGSQTPRYEFAPEESSNAADEAIDLMAQVGKPMYPWQARSLQLMLGCRPDGLWAAFEFGLIVARQNGKGGVLEGRELAGLFLFGERRIIHSAHEADTAAEAFERMREIIDGTSWLSKRVKKMNSAPGKQRIELMNGQKLSYRTRTASGGRGFSAPVVILDEAQALKARQLAAIMPVVSKQPNPQLIYAGTVDDRAAVLRGVVERGRGRIGTRLGYAEWSADPESAPEDRASWLDANPSSGLDGGLTLEYIQAEYDAFMSAGALAQFNQERRSIWPEAGALGTLIGVAEWEAGLANIVLPKSDEPIAVGVAVTPDRKWASVGFAWKVDGKTRLDLASHQEGTDWVIPFLTEIAARRKIATVAVDQMGPAGTLLVPMGAARLPVTAANTAGYKTAVAEFVDGVRQGRIQHRGQPELTVAVNGAREHKLRDGFVYARRDSVISPLEAVTLAAWGLTQSAPSEPSVIFL